MPREYDPESPFRAAGASYMLAQCRKVAKHLPGARRGEDPEDLHDVRVGLRRLRTAMVVFRACFPARQFQLWHGNLSQLADALTHVRDMDVQIEMIGGVRESLAPEHQAGIDAWLAKHEKRRAVAREEMVAVMDRWEADAMAEGLWNAIEAMGSPVEGIATRAAEIEATLLARSPEDFINAGEGSTEDV